MKPYFTDIFKYKHIHSPLLYRYDKIASIGFSKNGKFAYVTEHEVEGRGGTLYTYKIINTINDKIIWKYEDDIKDIMDDPYKFSYARVKDRLQKALQEHKIKYVIQPLLRKVPYKFDNNKISFAIKAISRKNKDGFNGNYLSLKVIARTNNGYKRVYYSKDKAFSYSIMGVFKSPYEPRIVLILAKEFYGSEGTALYYTPIGVHLKQNFR